MDGNTPGNGGSASDGARSRGRKTQLLFKYARDLKKLYKANKAMEKQLRDAQTEILLRLLASVEFRDNETGNHLKRISEICSLMAQEMGWDEYDVEVLKHASTMHDIGKIGIPDSILLKPGKLSGDEFEVMKRHTIIGGKILEGSTIPILQKGELVAMHHHEWYNGKGYPRGLSGDEIPIEGRIVAFADVLDALLSWRPYKEPFPFDLALGIIREEIGTHFDPDLAPIFFSLEDAIREVYHSFPDSKSTAYPDSIV